jgi:hypothetical protein
MEYFPIAPNSLLLLLASFEILCLVDFADGDLFDPYRSNQLCVVITLYHIMNHRDQFGKR